MWRSLILPVVAVAAFLWIQYHDAWFGPPRFLVCAGDGTPVRDAVVILRRAGAAKPDFSARTLGDGWFRTPRDRIHDDTEMFVAAPACGVVRGRIPDDDRIVLPEGIAVTLRIEGDFELPPPPHALQLVVEPEGVARADEALALAEAIVPQAFRPGKDWKPESMLLVDPATRSVSILVPQSGRFAVRWNVGARGHGTGTLWEGTGPPGKIPIEIREAGVTVSLEIPGDEIAKYAAMR
ncbi:MAG TPA: hypothetical protein VFY93_07255 [Planctomycetota bacterium]|nr:hypothetical protein [Planctomycetota bacterium]